MAIQSDTPTLYTFACNDVRTKRKDRPEIWIEADKVNGAMFRGYPYLLSPPDGTSLPVQRDDLIIDVDTGDAFVRDAIRILIWFETVYGIDPNCWRIFLSGKKGGHLVLPAVILGTLAGSAFLMLAYKRLIKDVEGELSLKCDTSMFNMGLPKPFRQPNVLREDIGTYKVQVSYDELCEISEPEEYLSLCSAPRPLFDPEPCGENVALAVKITAYIQESEENYGKRTNKPALTEDEIDKLAIKCPPCMEFLSRVRDPLGTGASFNDVSIQLTAYAITSGMSEGQCIGWSREFIMYYPSTSLNTLEKRAANCRARYRTMSAAGNQHSCGGVLSLRFPGFDCNSCHSKNLKDREVEAASVPVNEIMSAEELKDKNMSLIIPNGLLFPGGMISLGVQGLIDAGMPNIPQYLLPVVLKTISHAACQKLTFRDIFPNTFDLKVGPTSTAKSSSDKAMDKALRMRNLDKFYGSTDFSSGPALIRMMVDDPVHLMVLDEATPLFRRYGRTDPVSDGKRDTLLEIYSKSGQRIHKGYADSSKTLILDRPCLSLLGNVTPLIFETIDQADFESGMIQRIDFWTYDGEIPYRSVRGDYRNQNLTEFTQLLDALLNVRFSEDQLHINLSQNYPLGETSEVTSMVEEYSRQIINETRQTDSNAENGIISRKYDLSLKYAVIHHASACMAKNHNLTDPIDALDMQYGIAMAEMLAGWKLQVLAERVVTGDFHLRCEQFLQGIKSVMRMKKRPTFKLIMGRVRALKNWRKKDSEEVISILVKRGDIVIDDSKRPTAYWLKK